MANDNSIAPLTPEQIYQRKYYAANRERMRAQSRAWKAANRERNLAQKREYEKRKREAAKAGKPPIDHQKALNEKWAGKRFGRLVIDWFAPDTDGIRRVICFCDCGKRKLLKWRNVRKKTKSCGCLSVPYGKVTEAERKADQAQRDKERRLRNPAAFKARSKAWYLANAERARRQSLAKYYADRAANPEAHKLRLREWRRKNRQRASEQSRKSNLKRRAAMANATIGDLDAIAAWERRWKRKRTVQCHWCSGYFSPKDCHSDHVVPLSKGGPHSVENLVIACFTCNCEKGDLLPDEWQKKLEKYGPGSELGHRAEKIGG